MVQAYLGFAVTYEDILCGQIGLKHCKVWPGQKKVELLRVNTNVTGKEMAFTLSSVFCYQFLRKC